MPHDKRFKEKVESDVRGAYFRKVQSGFDVDNRGIRGVGVLPQVSFDPSRQYVSEHGLDHFTTGPLDRPSVYLGGHAEHKEMDVGLTWDRVYDAEKRPTYTDTPDGTDGRDPTRRFSRAHIQGRAALVDGKGTVVEAGQSEVEDRMGTLRPNFAFRPFWRTTNEGSNQWNQPKPGTPENIYFYPGERFTMTVQEAGPNLIRMDIRLEDSSDPQHFSTTFRQEGFGLGRRQLFKRVNSIDQFDKDASGRRIGREGKDVLPTRTTATGGGWDEVVILGPSGERPVPAAGSDFTEVRGGDLASRYDEIFRLSAWNAQGGERIDISPLKPA